MFVVVVLCCGEILELLNCGGVGASLMAMRLMFGIILQLLCVRIVVFDSSLMPMRLLCRKTAIVVLVPNYVDQNCSC